LADESALKSVDFPTFGRPTMPTERPMGESGGRELSCAIGGRKVMRESERGKTGDGT